MLLFMLGLIDFIGSILVFLTLTKIQVIASLGILVMLMLIAKGIYSIMTKSYFAAVVDLVSSGFLILAALSIYIHYVVVLIVGTLLFIKSLQSIIPEFLG